MKEFARLGKDPERFGQKENSPYKFSIALDKRKKKVDGSYDALWVDVVVFNDTPAFKTIEALAKSGHPLKKGSAVVIDGQLQQEEYEHQGAVRNNLVLRAYAIELPKLGGGSGSGSGSSGSNEAPTPAGVTNTDSEDAPGVAFDI